MAKQHKNIMITLQLQTEIQTDSVLNIYTYLYIFNIWNKYNKILKIEI